VKYNINNLDDFISDKDRINNKTFKLSERLVNQILENRLKMIEDRIKELISPYVDVETLNMLEIASELAFKDLELKCLYCGDCDEYNIIEKATGKKDYFTVKNNVDLESVVAQLYISDITRGID
jgi:hypothetical protein